MKNEKKNSLLVFRIPKYGKLWSICLCHFYQELTSHLWIMKCYIHFYIHSACIIFTVYVNYVHTQIYIFKRIWKKNLNVWVRLFGFISSFPCIPILNRGAGAVPLLTYSKVCTTTKIFLDFTVVLSFIVVCTIYRIFKNVISCLLASEFSITPTF